MARIPPKVVHVRKAAFDLYIGRAFLEFSESKWANPFRLSDPDDPLERQRCAEDYEAYIRGRVDLIAALHELEGLTLGCWCRPKAPCHGDVLVKLFKEFVK
jgi:hypothetical protein